MKKHKILFILHIPPPVHGSSMIGNYIKVSDVINKSFNARYINLGTSLTIDEIGKNPLKKTGRYFFILWQVLVQLIRFKPHLCYLAITAKGTAFFKDTAIAFLAKLFGVNLVYHFHNKGVETYQQNRIYNFLYKSVFHEVEVILLSKFLYPDVQKYLPESRVYYCPNGIPYIQQQAKNSAISSDNKKVELLFLSNLIETKGVFLLLEACRLLQSKHLPFHCTFVGGEGDITADQFQQKVQKLKLSNCVDYAGKKYDQEKANVFSKSDIFVHPTFEDCFPLVLLEAMQYELPTVSTFEGGIPEIIEDGKTGFLVPQKDPEALADKLEILIRNPELRIEMGKAGRKKYEKEFTLTAFEERLKDILNRIMDEK